MHLFNEVLFIVDAWLGWLLCTHFWENNSLASPAPPVERYRREEEEGVKEPRSVDSWPMRGPRPGSFSRLGMGGGLPFRGWVC